MKISTKSNKKGMRLSKLVSNLELKAQVKNQASEIERLKSLLAEKQENERRMKEELKQDRILSDRYHGAMEMAIHFLEESVLDQSEQGTEMGHEACIIKRLSSVVRLTVQNFMQLKSAKSTPVKQDKTKSESKDQTKFGWSLFGSSESKFSFSSLEDILNRSNKIKKTDISDTSEISEIYNISMNTECISDHRQQGIVGYDWTFLALKNKNSYMVGTANNGIKVIENSVEVYSNKLPHFGVWLVDMVYVGLLDCYLFYYNNQLYRKDIDTRPPFVFMSVICGHRVGACLRYSKFHKSWIINQDRTTISVVNLYRKKVEIEVNKTIGTNIEDFRVLGDQEDRVVSITEDGYIILNQLEYAERTGKVINSYQVTPRERKLEVPLSVAVCPKGEYILVELGEKPYKCSRVVVFRLTKKYIVKKATIDQYTLNIGFKMGLECFKYAGSHILWVGLSTDYNGIAQLYDYDTETRELKEHKDKRVIHQEFYPSRLHRSGDEFYYTGNFGRIMKLSFTEN